MASLSLKNVCKVYPNGFVAVKDFNLEIADQEFIIFVGPSGCGKSTMGKSVIRLIEPTDGKVILDGQDFTALKGKELKKARENIKLIFHCFVMGHGWGKLA